MSNSITGEGGRLGEIVCQRRLCKSKQADIQVEQAICTALLCTILPSRHFPSCSPLRPLEFAVLLMHYSYWNGCA